MVTLMNGISIGARRGAQISGGASGPTYDADATTLFAAMSVQPDSTRKALINTTILALKTAGIWTLLDRLWVMAAHDSQAACLDWKGVGNLTLVNAPTFVANQGFAGDGATSRINTGFIPSTHGANFALNDASLGVYSRTNLIDGNQIDMSGADASHRVNLQSGDSSNQMRYSVNTNANIRSGVGTVTDSRGFFVGRRTASGAANALRNGSSIDTDVTASTGRPTTSIYLCASNSNGTPASFSTRQLACAFFAASLLTQQQTDLYTIIQAYMTGVGANV